MAAQKIICTYVLMSKKNKKILMSEKKDVNLQPI